MRPHFLSLAQEIEYILDTPSVLTDSHVPVDLLDQILIANK